MTKRNLIHTLLMVCLTLCVAFGVATITGTNVAQAATATGLNKSMISLTAGTTERLKINGTTVTSWSTSDKKIAKVTAAGKVTAVKPGTATISAKCKDGNTYTCTVIVLKKLGNVEINEENFPGNDLRAFATRADRNKDGILSAAEAAMITEMVDDYNYYYRGSLKGLEYFTNLKALRWYADAVAECDLSQNPKLTTLYLNSYVYPRTDATMIIRNCPNLTTIDCVTDHWGDDGTLVSITLENCPKLKDVVFQSGRVLTTFNVINCPALETLNVGKEGNMKNNISTLTLKGCPNLKKLNCFDNLLTKLDLTECPNLEDLLCNGNLLTSLNISKCKKLKVLNCSNNALSKLNISKCTKLNEITCFNNGLKALDITKCTKLNKLTCSNNVIEKLSLTKCPDIAYVNCDNNCIESLDLSKCKKIAGLSCSENLILKLDISKCPTLLEAYEWEYTETWESFYFNCDEIVNVKTK